MPAGRPTRRKQQARRKTRKAASVPPITLRKDRDYRQIPLEELEVSESQVRTRDAGKRLDDLVSSIRQLGVLEPILVFQRHGRGKYQIVAGQRRYLAAKEIGLAAIPAVIIPEKPTETLSRVVGVTENLLREDLTERDLIDACTVLYRQYGSVQAVADETGIPAHRVSEYVKYERLGRPLKEAVDEGEIDIKVALQAQDIAGRDQAAVKVAKQLSEMTGAQRSFIARAAQNGGDAKRLLTEAGQEEVRLVSALLHLPGDIHGALKSFCRDQSKNLNDAVAELLTDALERRDYL